MYMFFRKGKKVLFLLIVSLFELTVLFVHIIIWVSGN